MGFNPISGKFLKGVNVISVYVLQYLTIHVQEMFSSLLLSKLENFLDRTNTQKNSVVY